MFDPTVPTLEEVDAASPTRQVAHDDVLVTAAYAEHRAELYGFLRRTTHDAEAAEDLLQDAFLRLTKEIAAGRRPEHVRAWLFQVAANLAVSRGRRAAVALRWLRGAAPRLSGQPFNPPEAGLIEHDRVASLERSLRRLTPDLRTALLMAGHGFSGAEIAVAIGRSEAATRTLMSRGRVRLRGILEDAGDDR